MNAKQRAAAFSWVVLAAMVAVALFVARLFILAVTGQPLALPDLGAWRGTLVVALQVAALALIMWKALPAFLTRYDRKVTALEEERDEHRAAWLDAEKRLRAVKRERNDAEQRATTAEARLEQADERIVALQLKLERWDQEGRKMAVALQNAQTNEAGAYEAMDLADKHHAEETARLKAQLDELRSAARSAEEERSAPPTLLGVVAFLRDLKALEKRSARAVPPLFRKHVGAAGNSPATFAAVRELLELLDERAGEGAARGTEQAEHAERSAEQGA